MAFFRNYSNDAASHSVLDEKEERENAATFQRSAVNEDVDGTYSERGFDINMDVQYQSDAEPECSDRLQNGATADNVVGHADSHFQPSGRRTGISGKWGSTFWKDCQPMGQRGGSDSGQDSHSDYKDADHSEDNLSNELNDRLESENEEQKVADKHQRGQTDVPADEMLSDEYYEQDEENQSDPVHYKRCHHPMNSRSLPKPVAASNSKSRASRAVHRNLDVDDDDDYGNNDDADADYEEEEDDEDDPEDADFEPDDAVPVANAKKEV